MRKLIIILCVAVTLSACSKPKKSPDFLFGSKLYNKYVEYYLKGQPRLAERAFANAENQFLKMDAMCNLSRIYIGRYVLDEGGQEGNILVKSSEYASLGNCTGELESIKYLSGEKYDKKLLPAPYNEIAEADSEKLVKLSGNKEYPDYTKTRLMRTAAIGYIVSNPAKAEELAEKALETDKFNGWSLNILKDLTIIKDAREKQSKKTDDIKKRIELVKAVLDKK